MDDSARVGKHRQNVWIKSNSVHMPGTGRCFYVFFIIILCWNVLFKHIKSPVRQQGCKRAHILHTLYTIFFRIISLFALIFNAGGTPSRLLFGSHIFICKKATHLDDLGLIFHFLYFLIELCRVLYFVWIFPYQDRKTNSKLLCCVVALLWQLSKLYLNVTN